MFREAKSMVLLLCSSLQAVQSEAKQLLRNDPDKEKDVSPAETLTPPPISQTNESSFLLQMFCAKIENGNI